MRSWIVGASLALATCGGESLPGAGGSSEDEGTAATATTTLQGGAEGIPSSVAEAGGESSEGGDEGPAGRVPSTCAVVDVAGECRDVGECGANDATFQSVCGGSPANQCCVPASQPCSHLGAPGLCLNEVLCPETFDLHPGSCPVEGPWRCCSDPLTRCDPTAVPLPNEGLVEEKWSARCQAGMVIVESDSGGADNCIDRYEASVVVLDEDGNVVSSWSPYYDPGETRVAAVSLRGAIPQGYIGFPAAAAACEESGKYLCSEAEWVRACRGPEFTVFPYGNKYRPGVCNDNRPVHPAMEYFGTEETWVLEELDHPCLSQLPHSLRVTGHDSECVSEWGVMDMMGNLAEWTAGGVGTARGGGYVIGAGAGCYYKAPPDTAATPPYTTGFRCCAQPL